VTFTLGNNVENLTLTGSANINPVGNGLANVLIGNSGVNIFAGVDGDDTEYGGDGADTLQGGLGNDTLYGEAGNDIMKGGDGNDYFNGGDGADTMNGLAGDDRFDFDLATAFSAVDTITDFNISTQEDILDFRDLLEEYDPLTETLADFVQIADSGSDSTVSVDRDGTGSTYSMVQIATLQGITGLTDEAALVTSGNLLAA